MNTLLAFLNPGPVALCTAFRLPSSPRQGKHKECKFHNWDLIQEANLMQVSVLTPKMSVSHTEGNRAALGPQRQHNSGSKHHSHRPTCSPRPTTASAFEGFQPGFLPIKADFSITVSQILLTPKKGTPPPTSHLKADIKGGGYRMPVFAVSTATAATHPSP